MQYNKPGEVELYAETKGSQVTRAWNFQAQILTTSKQVTIAENCFSFMFTNLGAVPVTVNGMILFPSATPATSLGDSIALSGHLLDLYKGNLEVAFSAGANPKLQIVQLFYTSNV